MCCQRWAQRGDTSLLGKPQRIVGESQKLSIELFTLWEFGFALIVPFFSLLKFFFKKYFIFFFFILPEHTVERFLNFFKRKFWGLKYLNL